MIHACVQSVIVNSCMGEGRVAKKRWRYGCIMHVCVYNMCVSSCEGGGRAAEMELVVREFAGVGVELQQQGLLIMIRCSEICSLGTHIVHPPMGLPTSCGHDGETPGLLICLVCVGKPGLVVSEAGAAEECKKAGSPCCIISPPHQHPSTIMGQKMGQRRLAAQCATLHRA